MFPSLRFEKSRRTPSQEHNTKGATPEGCGEKLLRTKKVGLSTRLHSMVKMRSKDLKAIGEAYEKRNTDNS